MTQHPDTESSLAAWTLALARPTIAPAGGSSAAIAAAMAASLVAMVTGLTLARQRYVAVHGDAEQIRTVAERLRRELLELANEDARALAQFSEALELPNTTESERERREAAKHHALTDAARVQRDVLRCAAELAELGVTTAIIGPPSAAGDATTATFLAAAAGQSAYWAIQSDGRRESDAERPFLERAERARQRVLDVLAERFG